MQRGASSLPERVPHRARRPSHLRVTTVIALLALASWIAIGPLGLGNRFTYVIINGNSMYPRLHQGDLVIVRRA